VHKADNLNTILCRCHEIWEPFVLGITYFFTVFPVCSYVEGAREQTDGENI